MLDFSGAGQTAGLSWWVDRLGLQWELDRLNQLPTSDPNISYLSA